MPITVPTAGTEIGVVQFGKPVADGINARKPLLGKYLKIVTSAPLADNTWTPVPGMTVFSFTFQTGQAYQLNWGGSFNGPIGAYAALGVWVNGSTIPDAWNRAMGLAATATNYDQAIDCCSVVSAAYGSPLPVGTVTLTLKAYGTPAISMLGGFYVSLIGLGADT